MPQPLFFAIPAAVALLCVFPLRCHAAEPGGPPEGATAQPPPLASKSSGWDKGFFLASEDGKYKLKFKALLQPRLAIASEDDGTGTRDTTAAMSMQRARFGFGGNVFAKALRYDFQAEFGKGALQLLDANFDAELGTPHLRVRFGQWLRPFARQDITSSSKHEMVNRSVMTEYQGDSREMGVAFHNGYEESPPFEWAVGMFNGTGIKPGISGTTATDPATNEGEITSAKMSNVPAAFHPAIIARAGVNTGGIAGYSGGDYEGGGLRWSAGVATIIDLDMDDDGYSAYRAQFDTLVKAHGFALDAAVFTQWNGDKAKGDTTFAALGWLAQAGYVIGGAWQPIGRVSEVRDEAAAGPTRELAVGFNWAPYGHKLKVQAHWGRISEENSGVKASHEIVTQLTLAP